MKRERKNLWKIGLISGAALALAILSVCGGSSYGGAGRRYSGLRTLTAKEYAQLQETRQEKSGAGALSLELSCGGRSLPYDARTNTFMRSSQVTDGKLTVRASEKTQQEDHGEPLQLAKLPEGQGIVAYSQSAYSSFTFWETQMPVIVLHTGEKQEIGEQHYEDIALTVYDPADGALAMDVAAGIHTRGASSGWIDKKSYRLKLESIENFVGKRYGFFGMKPAREWILFALYGDESKMREKLSRDVWNEMAADSAYADCGTGLEMTYCEVYLNDEYIGLYGMGTAVDGENYWQEKNEERQDLLFKSINFVTPTQEEIAGADAATDILGCLELKYASWRSDDMWQTIGEYLTLAYHASDEAYARRMKSYMNVDNHIDYWLFLLAAGLDDNELKNIYFTLEDAGNNRQVLLTPWDMDLSWGVGYTGEDIFMWGRNDMQYRKIMNFPIVSRMFDLRDEEMIAKTRERWAYLRDTVLTEENLLGHLEEYEQQLWQCGVMQREMARWPDAKYTSDMTYIENYVKQRLPYLDAYMAQLGEGDWDDGWD